MSPGLRSDGRIATADALDWLGTSRRRAGFVESRWERAVRPAMEDERVGGFLTRLDRNDPRDDVGVVAGVVLVGEPAFDPSGSIVERRTTIAIGPPHLGEAVHPFGGEPAGRVLVMPRHDVDADAPTSRMTGHVSEERAGQKRTSRGSSDTEVTEFAAIPTGVPAL
jgi:hypothetical protein